MGLFDMFKGAPPALTPKLVLAVGLLRGAGRKLDGENFEKRLMAGRGTRMQTSKSRLPGASDEVLMQSIPARSESHRYQRPVPAVRNDK